MAFEAFFKRVYISKVDLSEMSRFSYGHISQIRSELNENLVIILINIEKWMLVSVERNAVVVSFSDSFLKK